MDWEWEQLIFNKLGNIINFRVANVVKPNKDYKLPSKSKLNQTRSDIFGDLNVAFTRANNTDTLTTVDTVKIGYDGKIKNHTTTQFTANRI